MGFYLKKGFNIGPVRVNLSKSGIGVSVGEKGLRLGCGPHGNYLHVGRHGVYYRKKLSAIWGTVVLVAAIIAIFIYYALEYDIISINL